MTVWESYVLLIICKAIKNIEYKTLSNYINYFAVGNVVGAANRNEN